jgi:hypothetical protein
MGKNVGHVATYLSLFGQMGKYGGYMTATRTTFGVTTEKPVYPKAPIPKSPTTEKPVYPKGRIPKSPYTQKPYINQVLG